MGWWLKTLRSAGPRDRSVDASSVYLVYARSGPDRDEPLVAVVGTEDEARAIEADIGRREPTTRVMWETHPVTGVLGDTVSVMLLSAGESDAVSVADPIGIAVFARQADAERDLAARASDGNEYVVGAFPLPWHRSGWPFVTPPRSRM